MREAKFQFLEHHFKLPDAISRVTPLGSGHIHDTYLLTCADNAQSEFVLQRFNHAVFKNPEQVMSNIDRVLEHIGKAKSDSLKPLRIIKTFQGGLIHLEGDDYYRIYNYIGESDSYDQVTDTSQAVGGARAFGEFIELLNGLNPDDLYTTIPDFHNLNVRFQQLKHAIESDPVNRVSDYQREVAFAVDREERVLEYSLLLDHPEIPYRVTHNDTKINNVLFEKGSTKAVCVVDLDTIMPGLLLFDFGDMARTFCNAVLEEGTAEQAEFRLDIFEAMCEGFFQSLKSPLAKAEIDSLKAGPWWLTYIMAIRFLADFLNGDIYYKINSPLQNLDRARNQLNLVKDIENKQSDINRIVDAQAKQFGHS